MHVTTGGARQAPPILINDELGEAEHGKKEPVLVQATGVCQWTLHECGGNIYVVSLQCYVLPESPWNPSEKHWNYHPHSTDLWSHFTAVPWTVVRPDSPQVRQKEDISPGGSECCCSFILLHLARVHNLCWRPSSVPGDLLCQLCNCV